MKKRTAPLALGIGIIFVITITITVIAGNLTARWGSFSGQEEASSELRKIPLQIGDWIAETEGVLDDVSITMLQIQNSYIVRLYKHAVTQEIVHLTLMVGPTGKITVHTPEVCFGGRDFEKEATRSDVPIDVQLTSGKDVADTFWRVNFVGRSVLDTSNRISFYYAVSTGDAWLAIEDPRSTLQKYRYVYKLQAQARSGVGGDGDSAQKFLKDCLPTIHEHLRQCQ